MEWLQNLSDAIEYIENNLDKEITYAEAARIACCSTYYFQRMFTYVAGISLSEYIRRRRMTQAAFELQTSDSKVLDVALKYGYTSPTSFNRAFQSVHGIPPISAKIQGNILNAYPPIRFSVNITGGKMMPFRIVKKEAMHIVGIRIPLTVDMAENQKNVPAFWEETFNNHKYGEICNLSNKSPQGILGITACHGADEFYYYIAAATDKPTPKDMFWYEIPAATWVVFENTGPFKESVQSIFKRFLTEWLPFSGYTYAELPDIEVYPISEEKQKAGNSEVWIAVKKEKED